MSFTPKRVRKLIISGSLIELVEFEEFIRKPKTNKDATKRDISDEAKLQTLDIFQCVDAREEEA